MKLDHIQLAMPVGREDEARGFFIGILEMKEEEKPEPLASRGGWWMLVSKKGSYCACWRREKFHSTEESTPGICRRKFNKPRTEAKRKELSGNLG